MSSVCPSVCDVGGWWSHWLEFFRNRALITNIRTVSVRSWNNRTYYILCRYICWYKKATAMWHVCTKPCFCHLNVVWRPLADERLAMLTQNNLGLSLQGSLHLGLVGYISVANMRVYLHSFSCYCLRNTRHVAKFQENLTLQQFKVIQRHRSWCQFSGKPICDLAVT